MPWSIRCSDRAAEDIAYLGGRDAIGIALETVFDGLKQNPFGFDKVDIGAYSFRYVKTVRIGGVTPLVIVYTVSVGMIVTIEFIEVA